MIEITSVSRKNYIVAKALYARIVDLYDRTSGQKAEPAASEAKEELWVLCDTYKDFADGIPGLNSESRTIAEILLKL